MKLVRLHLQNFRCFERLVVDFDPKLTVIVAENGAGKTSILDALSIGFGRFLTKLPGVNGVGTKESDLLIDEKEHRAPFLHMGWEVIRNDKQPLNWAGGRRRTPNISSSDVRAGITDELAEVAKNALKPIDAYAASLAEASDKGEAFFLPVIAYYGTNRAIREVVQRRRNFRKEFSRFDALVGALDPDSRFKAAFEWFTAMEDVERREKEARRNFDYRLPVLDHVRTAISRMMGDCSNPRTEIRPLRFLVDKRMSNGVVKSLRVTQLSDGYRVVLGLVMDLARRMAQANSQFATNGHEILNPLDLPAIVLIDEVELHLHPGWQQRILGDLARTFPSAQFVVTTHSPQVLTTVDSECIRVLSEGQIHASPPGTKGAEASRLLKRVLGVEVRPPADSATKELDEYLALVQSDQWMSPRAVELRTILDERYQGEEPALIDADLHIENCKWEMGGP
jgi:predicted ATP-binding protein involved in virulence